MNCPGLQTGIIKALTTLGFSPKLVLKNLAKADFYFLRPLAKARGN